MLEARRPGQKEQTKRRQVDHLALGDHGHHLPAQVCIGWSIPEPSGFYERVGHSDVGIGGRVLVDYLPIALVGLSPQPYRQMGAHVSASQVGLCPLQNLVEVPAIIVSQGENMA